MISNNLVYISLIVIIIMLLVFLTKYLMKSEERFSVINRKKITDQNIAMSLFETGDNKINIYDFSVEAIHGRAPQGGLIGHSFGFMSSELKAKNMKRAIKVKNKVEYVDNSLMVPYIVSALQLLKKQMDMMQDNLNLLADKNFKS